jgi:universal stress protein E
VQTFTSILVDVDVTVPVHPALERAVRLARAAGARITVVDVLTLPPIARAYLPPAFEEEAIARTRLSLTNIARGITDVPTDAKLLSGRPATALIQEVLRSRHDLLIRSHARDTTSAEPRPFGAVDMELLRKCPCPVLLARPGDSVGRRRIVGAVNASTHLADEQALNASIRDLAVLMATLDDGEAMLLQAWAPFAERMVRSNAAAGDFATYVEKVRVRSTTDLAELARPDGRGPGLPVVLRRGDPERVIPEFAAAEGVDLVVMGTVARGGIAGLLFGNTAERVLRRMPCSVLAVKPASFISPVTLDTLENG